MKTDEECDVYCVSIWLVASKKKSSANVYSLRI
jgi:hypothetical protein